MSEEISAGDRIRNLENRIDELARKIDLEDARDVIDEIEQKVRELPNEIEKVRARGYQFRSFLEKQTSVMYDQWRSTAERAQETLEDKAQDLRRELREAERRVRELRNKYAPGAAGPKQGPSSNLGAEKKKPRTLGGLTQERGQEPERQSKPDGSLSSALSSKDDDLRGVVEDVERFVDDLESRIDEAEWEIRRQFDKLTSNVSQVNKHVREINWTMDQVQEAAFQFNAGESPVIIAKAEWLNNDDNPNGILYLTDQRLLFEQKEKKGGFLGLGGKKVQEVEWEVEVGDIQLAKSYNEGFFGRKDMIEMTLGGGAPFGQIIVEVKGDADNDWWIRQINRARTGDILKEKLGAEGEQFDDVDLSEVPTNCPNCSGMFPDIKQGQRELQCEFCGTVVRF